MKKLIPVFLGGLTLISISIGLFTSKPFLEANAAPKVLKVDSKEHIEFGRFATTYDEELNEALNTLGQESFIQDKDNVKQAAYPNGGLTFTINNEEFLLANSIHFTNAPAAGVQLSTGKFNSADIENKPAVFKIAPIKWSLLSEDNGFTNYITDNIIVREQYNETNYATNPYYSSNIRNVLNGHFKEVAFTDDESGYLNTKDIGGDVNDYIDLPTKKGLNSSEENKGATDFVKCNGIDLENSDYSFWTKDIPDEQPSKVIALSKIADPNDETIGARIIIRLKVKVKGGSGGGGGGSTTPTFNTNFTGNLPMLIVGFVLLVGGIVFLVIFVIKWSKKIRLNPKFRHPWWYYLIIGICITITITGCNLFAFGTIIKFPTISGFGGKGQIYGLYTSGTYLDDDANSEDWDWQGITHGVYALTKDGKVYHYIGNYPVGKQVIREEGEGTYTVKGNEITINYPENWRTFTWEHSPMTYKIKYGQYWEVSFYLDYDVQFATSVPPLVTGSGLYNKNYSASNHNPDGRPYYTTGELGY